MIYPSDRSTFSTLVNGILSTKTSGRDVIVLSMRALTGKYVLRACLVQEYSAITVLSMRVLIASLVNLY